VTGASDERLHNGRAARVEVQVAPVHAEHLAAAHPRACREPPRGGESVAVDVLEERVTSLASHVRIVGAFASLAEGGSAASVGLRTSRFFRTASPRARRRMVCV
jgi:hypothetical protein